MQMKEIYTQLKKSTRRTVGTLNITRILKEGRFAKTWIVIDWTNWIGFGLDQTQLMRGLKFKNEIRLLNYSSGEW